MELLQNLLAMMHESFKMLSNINPIFQLKCCFLQFRQQNSRNKSKFALLKVHQYFATDFSKSNTTFTLHCLKTNVSVCLTEWFRERKAVCLLLETHIVLNWIFSNELSTTCNAYFLIHSVRSKVLPYCESREEPKFILQQANNLYSRFRLLLGRLDLAF